MTNYELIRNMSINTMVDFLNINEGDCGCCPCCDYCYDTEELEGFSCEDRIELWLLSESK